MQNSQPSAMITILQEYKLQLWNESARKFIELNTKWTWKAEKNTTLELLSTWLQEAGQ